MEGYVKFFNPVKNYGFIKGEEKEFFFHISEVADDAQNITDGVKVEFEIAPDPKGEKAINIKIIK